MAQRRKREALVDLPRWVTEPLLADWLSPREMAEYEAGDMMFLGHGLYRYYGGLEYWSRLRGIVWADVERGYPSPGPARPGGPPPDVLAAARAASGPSWPWVD